MTSENLDPVARTTVAQGQELASHMEYACTLAYGHPWVAYIAMLAAIGGDISRLLQVQHIVPGNYVLPQRKDSP